jgi:hypothetical protein
MDFVVPSIKTALKFADRSSPASTQLPFKCYCSRRLRHGLLSEASAWLWKHFQLHNQSCRLCNQSLLSVHDAAASPRKR